MNNFRINKWGKCPILSYQYVSSRNTRISWSEELIKHSNYSEFVDDKSVDFDQESCFEDAIMEDLFEDDGNFYLEKDVIINTCKE